MANVPTWLLELAWTWISVCAVCALLIGAQTVRQPQKMWIMDMVWPITALYMGPFAVYLFRKSLPVSKKAPQPPHISEAVNRHESDPPTWLQSSIAVFHCGAGCTIGDVIAETTVPAFGLMFAGEFGSKLILDFAFAYVFGVVFQYFTIVPMRGLSFAKGVAAAIRADTISIALFEVGMFAWMAVTYFLLFPGPHLNPGTAVFWFMMQIAMVIGFLTALPANAWLIRKGWKEKMPPIDPAQLAGENSRYPVRIKRPFAA